MSALTANTNRLTAANPLPFERFATVKTGEVLYEGSITQVDGTNGAEPADGSQAVVGVSKDYFEAGDLATIEYRCIQRFELAGAVRSETYLGAIVYASNDNDVTLTPNSAPLGEIVDVPEDGIIQVFTNLYERP